MSKIKPGHNEAVAKKINAERQARPKGWINVPMADGSYKLYIPLDAYLSLFAEAERRINDRDHRIELLTLDAANERRLLEEAKRVVEAARLLSQALDADYYPDKHGMLARGLADALAALHPPDPPASPAEGGE